MTSGAAMEKSFKCNFCPEKFNSLCKLNVHNKNQHDKACDTKKTKNKCNVCGYEFTRGGRLIKHMRTHTGERPFKCSVDACGMAFKGQSNLNDHIKYKHSDERSFTCDFPGCLHTAKTSANMYQHKKAHSSERPFSCPNEGCSVRAKWKSDIVRHVKCVHNEAKAFACPKCDYKTAQKQNLTIHMSRIHFSRRDFKCNHPQCSEAFKSSSDLRSHISNRHSERNNKCDHPGCSRKFANVKALSKHKRRVHSRISHACPHPNCSYSTSDASNLSRHMVVHEGKNQTISCVMEGCGYRGNNRKALEAHIRRHKKLVACPVIGCGQYGSTKEALMKHAKLHNPSGRPFQCPLCFKNFRTLDGLQVHCVVHTNEKPFQCGHCKYEAAVGAHVKTHISSAHASIEFPFIVRLPDDRECLRCKVILPSVESEAHCKAQHHVETRY